MIKTEQELRTFLNKRPSKGMVNIEIQLLNKEIDRLNCISSEYGKDNSRLSNSYKKRNNCWTPMEQWDTKDRIKFYNNQDKKQKLLTQIEDLKSILKELKDYNCIEYIQTKLDFDKLNETLKQALDEVEILTYGPTPKEKIAIEQKRKEEAKILKERLPKYMYLYDKYPQLFKNKPHVSMSLSNPHIDLGLYNKYWVQMKEPDIIHYYGFNLYGAKDWEEKIKELDAALAKIIP